MTRHLWNIELTYQLAILLIDIYSRELKAETLTGSCVLKSTSALTMEATHSHQLKDEEKVWYIHPAQYYLVIITYMRYNVDEPKKYAKSKKQITEDHMQHDSTCIKSPEYPNPQTQN